MVIALYAGAALFLVVGLAADSPFTKTDFIIFALASFLTGRLVSLERRLDRIEGIRRVSWITRATLGFKRAGSWLWLRRDGIAAIGGLAFFLVLLWLDWGPVTQSVSDDLTAISPKSPHPSLHSVLGANRLVTAILVGFPICAFLVLLMATLVGSYVIALATLAGYLPRKNQRLSRASLPNSNYQHRQVAFWAVIASLFFSWLLFVTYYAEKEADSLFTFLSSPTTDFQVLVILIVGLGWMPLVFVARAVHRSRERRLLTPNRS